eukprot:jgi/Bigna1/139498/aug1.50_g14206
MGPATKSLPATIQELESLRLDHDPNVVVEQKRLVHQQGTEEEWDMSMSKVSNDDDVKLERPEQQQDSEEGGSN